MGLVALTAEAYARMMRALLPPGRIWRTDADGILSLTLLAGADELERLGQRAIDLLTEADPRTTSELLPEFETDLDLVAEGTEDERRARVVALLIAQQRVRPVDFQEVLAPLLGLDAEDIPVIENSRAFAISVGDDRIIYLFHIYRDPDLPGTYDLEAAQILLDRIAHSHTKGKVIESIDFLCDDEFSLCDRDLLGA